MDIANGIGLKFRTGLKPFVNIVVLAMKYQEDSGFIALGDYDFILVKGMHKKRAHSKLKVSDTAKDYYRVRVLKSSMHTAVQGRLIVLDSVKSWYLGSLRLILSQKTS